MSRLLLVRHGETKLNDPKRFWGHTDIELSDSGVKQAVKLSKHLAGEKINAIYASTLKRCLVTAQMIADKHGLEVVPCDELNEINFGYVEGLTFTEISRLYPDLAKALADWKAHPEFPGGESFDSLNERVLRFLPRLQEHEKEETVLVVAHNGPLRLMVCNLLGLTVEHWLQMRIDLASLSVMETYPQGAILDSLNDVSHLKANIPPGGQFYGIDS